MMCNLMTVSQNGKYSKLKIIAWVGIGSCMACALFCIKNIFPIHLYMPHQSAKSLQVSQLGLNSIYFKYEEDSTSLEIMSLFEIS